MSRETIVQFRARAAFFYQQAQQWISRLPVKARVILGLFLAAAVLTAVHTATSPKNASLYLIKVAHGFHEAEVPLWVDSDLAFSGRVTGAARKKFGSHSYRFDANKPVPDHRRALRAAQNTCEGRTRRWRSAGG